MSDLDQLPPEQRAVLSLLLRQGKGYDDVAALLRIDPEAVRERAVAALTALGPGQLSELSPQIRLEVGDYLLGQQTPSEGEATRALFQSSPDARDWAESVASQVAELSANPLPEIPAAAATTGAPPATPLRPPAEPPAEPPEPPPGPGDADEPPAATKRPGRPGAPPPRRPPAAGPGLRRVPPATEADGPDRGGRAPSSRRGGYVVLGALAVILAVVIIIILNGGISGGGGNDNAAVTGTTATTSSVSHSTTSAAAPKIEAQINFTPPNPSSHALAVADIISQGSLKAFALTAQGLAPTDGFAYAVWLYNSPSDAKLLGFINQQVTSNGQAKAIAPLPADAAHFGEIVITKETAPKPTQPGTIVLTGQLGSAG